MRLEWHMSGSYGSLGHECGNVQGGLPLCPYWHRLMQWGHTIDGTNWELRVWVRKGPVWS